MELMLVIEPLSLLPVVVLVRVGEEMQIVNRMPLLYNKVKWMLDTDLVIILPRLV